MESISTYLHFVLLIQPILFAIQLFTYNAVFSKPHRILGIYMVLISIYFFVNANFITIPAGIDRLTNILVIPLFLSLNPFYYLYVKALTSPRFRMSRRVFLHFIPGVVFLVVSIIAYFGHYLPEARPDTPEGAIIYEDVLQVIFGYPALKFAILIYYAQFAVYLFMMILMLVQHKSRLGQYFSYKENISLNWLWIFLAIYLIFSLFDTIVYYANLYENASVMYFIIMILFINFLGFFGIKQSDIYLHKLTAGKISVEAQKIEKPKVVAEVVQQNANSEGKYSGSSLSLDSKNELLIKIKEIMGSEFLYRDSNLSINDLAVLLNTNYKYISQVINEIEGINFYNFVNEYRVEEAKMLLKDPESKKLSFEGIANLVGFHSRSAFNNSFKKFTGLTPSEFLKQDVNQ
ncbi:MAG: AraC family transcriptional regulator [Bacteroidales bacterium]|nr:AraC family transcriptional regulator [Bacteroidales bacterium]